MAGPALQLFPPPPRAPRQTSPNRRPIPQAKSSTPEPPAQNMDTSKASKPSADFHELVIQVNSVPVSPSSTIAPLPAALPRVYVANSHAARTPPQLDAPTFPSAPRQRAASPNLSAQEDSHREQNGRAPSPFMQARSESRQQQQQQQQQVASPELARAVSPAFSTCETLVRANSTATRVRSMSPEEIVPMRSMFPVYDPTVPLTNQSYRPSQASPTHIPRTQISRSPYSPDAYIPHSNVRPSTSTSAPLPPRPFFTPSYLLDNLWLATNGQEQPSVQIYTVRMHRATAANPTITFGTTPSLPFYSLAQSNLAGAHEVPSIMNELLIQRHHPTQPRVLPVAHLDLMAPPSLDTVAFNPQQQEATTLLTTILPKLAALQALDAAANSPAASQLAWTDPGAQSPAAQRLAEDVLAGAAERECCALTWTRDDPSQHPNPWAKHIPSEGNYQLHHPTLGSFPIKVEGDCSVINTPSTRPVTAIYGPTSPRTPSLPAGKPASISILNPFVLSPTTPRTNAFSPLPPPPRLNGLGLTRPVSLTPSEMSISALPTTTDAAADDAILAKLDFTHDALSLNIGAITRFGNPFLPDVLTSSLLAVAVAEAIRGRKASQKASQESFEPPPPSWSLTGAKGKDDTGKAFKDSFVDGFNSFGGKTKMPMNASSLKRFASSLKSGATSRSQSTAASYDKDIELGDWYGQGKAQAKATKKESKTEKKSKKENDHEDKLPFVARSIIGLLTFAFKSVVFVLKIIIKIVAGVVVMITKNLGRL